MENLLERLERLMEIARDSLEIKRKVLEDNMLKGLYPYSKYYLEDIFETYQEYWHNHFATIGPNGMNECIEKDGGAPACGSPQVGGEQDQKCTDACRDHVGRILVS